MADRTGDEPDPADRPTVLPEGSGVAPVPSDDDPPQAREPERPTSEPDESGAGVDDEGASPDAAADGSESPAATPPAAAAPDPQTGARGAAARRAAVTGLRIATGAIGAAVAVGALLVVSLTPLRGVAEPVPAATVRPVPAPVTRVCPGTVLALGGEGGQDAATAASVGRATVVARASTGELDRSTVTPSASEAQLLTSGSASGAVVAGAQSQRVATDDLSGLATAACADPTGTSWLVAGSTTTGRTTLVGLVNPTAVDAIVELRVWTEQGPVEAPGLRGIVVAAGAQKVLSLAGFAQNASAPVVEVRSTGGRVVATSQESILRAVDPGGVDVASSASASTDLVIPGVTITTRTAVDTLRARTDYEDLQPVLRLLDPGDDDTTVRVGIRPEKGGDGTAFDVPLTAGKALDVPIDDLAEGAYTIEIEANAPVVAGMRISTALPLSGTNALEAPVSDLAWLAAAPPVDTSTLFAAPGVPSRLHAANPGSKAVTLRLEGEGTADLTLEVPAGSSGSVDLAASGVYRIDPSSPVRLQVVSQTSGGIAAYPVAPPPVASSPLVIRR